MHFRKMAKSPYLASQDFWDDQKKVYVDRNLTIKDVVMEMSQGLAKNEIFMFAKFEENVKDMIINSTNSMALRKACKSAETDDWRGKTVQIFVKENVSAFGGLHDALRVRPQLPVIKKADVSKEIEALKACDSLSKLKEVYSSLPNNKDQRVVKVKDEMKTKLQ